MNMKMFLPYLYGTHQHLTLLGRTLQCNMNDIVIDLFREMHKNIKTVNQYIMQ